MSLLEFRDAAVADGTSASVSGLSFALEPGERLVVFGSAGSGKRALLKTAAGVLRPFAGTARLEAGGRPCPVGYVPKEGGLLNNATLLDNVILPAVYHRLHPLDEARRRGLRLLGELGVERLAGLRPAAATASARRLAQLARALLCEPLLFVLESPLDEMDAPGAAAVRRVLDRIKADGRAAAVLGTGSPAPYLDWAGRFLMIQGHGARAFGGRAELLADPDPGLRPYLAQA